MTEQKTISKSLRFDTFKRDAFTCQYCGQRPPDVVLELDHIHPVSKGGDNDEMNLVTSCFDCNRGKRDKVLKDYVPRPDADLAWLEMQQELSELRRYNDAKAMRDDAILETIGTLEDHWQSVFGVDWVPIEKIMKAWIKTFGPSEVEMAIDLATFKKMKGYISDSGLIKYVAGILWKRKRGEDAQAARD